MEVQIQSIHFDADVKLEAFVQKKLEKLETYYDRIVNAEVFLKLENNGSQIKNKIAHIKVHVPGATLFAEEKTKVFEESVDLAAESLRRQLKKHKEKIRK